jgi:hypothetical protein
MGGSNTQPTQTSTTTPNITPQQQELMDIAMPKVREFAASVPERYQGETVAGFDPVQMQAQQMALDAADATNRGAVAQDSAAKAGLDASNFWLGDRVWDPANNPALAKSVDAAVRPITQNYQQVVRPAIRDEFTGAGQEFGGSRRDLTEVAGADAYLRNVGDTSGKLINAAYDTNVNAQLKALGLLPSTTAAQTAGANSMLGAAGTTAAVGDVRRGMTQAQIDAMVGGYNYDQLAPFLQTQELMSFLQGMPGGGTTTVATGNNPSTRPTAMTSLGGAATGASLGTALMPGIGTVAGAGIGALLPWIT